MIQGKVKIELTVYEDEQHNHCVIEELTVSASADYIEPTLEELVQEDGSVDTPYAYYDNIVVDENEIDTYVESYYNNVKFAYGIITESFKED